MDSSKTTGSSSKYFALVTGANRGLGLGFVEKILAGSDDLPFLPADVIVVATARDPTKATALHELKEKYGDRLVICTLDQTIPASLTEFLVELDNAKVTHIDLLILNAGTVEPNPAASIADLDRAEALHILHTNSLAPILLANALIPRLNAAQTARGGEVETVEMDKNAGSDGPKDPKDVKLEHTKGMHRPKKVDRPTHVRVVFVSSSMGSIGACCNSNAPSYRASKAALNMYIRCFAFQYPHLAVMPLHPGWVQTDMGKRGQRSPPTSVDDSIAGCLRQIKDARVGESSKRMASFDDTTWVW